MPSAPRPDAWRIALPHAAAAIPMARALVRTALADVAEPVHRETAELLTAELVANAVEHTDGNHPIDLFVELLADGCRIEVHDHDPAPPGDLAAAQSDPFELAEGGRGLLLIRTLSGESGYRRTSDGKAVWFTLPFTPPRGWPPARP